jgi:hypothetical protein
MKSILATLVALLWLLLLLPGSASAQLARPVPAAEPFQKYLQTTLTEKLFVHLDRPLYVVGETMWFRMYCVEGSSHRPLDVSRVAYLEVLDQDAQPVVQTKLAMAGGLGAGSVALPATLPGGTYTVRSYTSWMKNFSPDFFFETTITILNPFERPAPPPVAAREVPAWDVQFFPEGGQLVSQLESRVAFRAVGPDGKGIAFRGALMTETNDTLLHFRPLRFGIGRFAFTPTAGTRYRAVVQDSLGRTHTYPLPAVQPAGYVMQVQDSTAQLVRVTVAARQVPSDRLYLLAHTRQGTVQSQEGTLQGGKITFILLKSTLAEGITHLTVFDEQSRPVAGRLYFRRPDRPLVIRENLPKSTFGTREKVPLTLSTPAGAPADLSVSVYLLDSLAQPDLPHLDHYLLLTSDLKGTLESPASYFHETGAATNPEVDLALDNLLLTHGWSRFRWNEVLSGTPPEHKYLPEHGGHFVEGRVYSTLTGQPTDFLPVFLAAPTLQPRLFVALSDKEGYFRLEVKKLRDTQEVLVQTNTRRDSTYRIELFSPYSDQLSSRRLVPRPFPRPSASDLLTRSINMQTLNAYHPRALAAAAAGSDSLAFYGQPQEKYFLDAFTRFPTMEEVMREYVPGVFVRKRQGRFQFNVVNSLVPQGGTFNEDPLILLDGVPVFDTDKIMAVNPLLIRKLEVVTGQYYLGKLSFPGVVSYTSYKGDLAGLAPDPRALVLSYAFVQSDREFYAPRYDTPARRNSRLPDLRNLLHWAPGLRTDERGQASLDFFTSDQPGTYRVVVQGLSETGAAGSRQFTFEVTPPARQ